MASRPQAEPEIDAELPLAGHYEHSLDLSLAEPADAATERPISGPYALHIAEAESGAANAEAAEAGEIFIEHRNAEPDPVEMVLESSSALSPPRIADVFPRPLPVAQLRLRVLAGAADTAVLLSAAALFELVFWRSGGYFSPQPLNLLVYGFIAAFFIFIYFGVFTALTSSTPGLLWMGLEIRNFEGEYPTTAESFWRAFGYLISISGLMLGFVWIFVDSEGLGWHDWISSTFLTSASKAGTLRREGAKAALP